MVDHRIVEEQQVLRNEWNNVSFTLIRLFTAMTWLDFSCLTSSEIDMLFVELGTEIVRINLDWWHAQGCCFKYDTDGVTVFFAKHFKNIKVGAWLPDVSGRIDIKMH